MNEEFEEQASAENVQIPATKRILRDSLAGTGVSEERIDFLARTLIAKKTSHVNSLLSKIAGDPIVTNDKDATNGNISFGSNATDAAAGGSCPKCGGSIPTCCRCPAPTNYKDRSVIDQLFKEFHYSDNLGVIKTKLTEYVTTTRLEAVRDSKGTCTWSCDPDPDFEVWETACGNTFQFETGGPAENKMRFCCYCGAGLIEAAAKEGIVE